MFSPSSVVLASFSPSSRLRGTIKVQFWWCSRIAAYLTLSQHGTQALAFTWCGQVSGVSTVSLIPLPGTKMSSTNRQFGVISVSWYNYNN